MRRQCARRSKLRPAHGASRTSGASRAVSLPPAGGRAPEGRLGAARRRASASPEGPLRRAASAQAEPSGTACAAGVAGLARLAEAPPTGPEARTAPQPPLRGGRAAPEHLRRNRRGGGAKQGPPQAACLGLALRKGAPEQRLAANLAGTRHRRGLGRHITRHGLQGRDGAGGGTAAAQGGQGVGPQAGGAGGTRPARRRDTDGSPFSWPLTGRENEKRECPPGTPSCLLIDADRVTVGQVWGCPPPPLGQVPYIGHLSVSRGDNTGVSPLYPVRLRFADPGGTPFSCHNENGYGISGASLV